MRRKQPAYPVFVPSERIRQPPDATGLPGGRSRLPLPASTAAPDATGLPGGRSRSPLPAHRRLTLHCIVGRTAGCVFQRGCIAISRWRRRGSPGRPVAICGEIGLRKLPKEHWPRKVARPRSER